MTNYTKTTNFTTKDSLPSLTPAKALKGTELDTEFDAIATAIATKEDATNKGVASGYASLDGTTLVPRAQLGTGTPNSTKYLNGDGTWHPTSEFATAGTVMAAASVTYDHTTSGLAASQVQAAIDELAATITPPARTFVISQDTVNFNLLEQLGGAPASPVTVTITVKTGVLVGSLSTQTPAMDLMGLVSGSIINLTNLGAIIGKGGDGSNGGSLSGTAASGLANYQWPNDASPGGHAIKGPGTGVTLNITNAAGYVYGGGGGGGGGGFQGAGGGVDQVAGGGGGGGGAGGGQRGLGGASALTLPGTKIKGANGTDGGHGRAGVAGTGGAGVLASSPTAVYNGGSGGAYGANGSDGSGTTTYSGAGGTAGKAIDVQSGTANFVSGNDATHVKGLVS